MIPYFLCSTTSFRSSEKKTLNSGPDLSFFGREFQVFVIKSTAKASGEKPLSLSTFAVACRHQQETSEKLYFRGFSGELRTVFRKTSVGLWTLNIRTWTQKTLKQAVKSVLTWSEICSTPCFLFSSAFFTVHQKAVCNNFDQKWSHLSLETLLRFAWIKDDQVPSITKRLVS